MCASRTIAARSRPRRRFLSPTTHTPSCSLTRFAIGSPASALFRRVVFDEVGPWSDNFEAGADYELYLRIARWFPICTHARPVAVYRRHSEEMSRSPERMLREIALVWRAQRPHLHERAGLRAAYDEGCRHWIGYYGRRTLAALLADLRAGRLRNAAKRATVLASVAPRFVASTTAVWARSSRTRY